jgi:hypothetical protein
VPPARAHLGYTLYIRLAQIEPPISRRIIVPANLTLHQVHQVLQVTMGWMHSHLHQFLVPGTQESISYGEPSPEDDYFHKDDRRARLADIAPKEVATFVYEYDFGDSWSHEITVERINPTPKGELPYPWCLDGQRACPPEDVGGVSGYANVGIHPLLWRSEIFGLTDHLFISNRTDGAKRRGTRLQRTSESGLAQEHIVRTGTR